MIDIICDLYCRVSTTDQADDGYSLGEQEERLRAYAKAHGWIVHACHVDPGFSGSKLERPGIQAVIADAKAHRIQRVVTYKLDRLSRSQKDTLHLIEDVFLANGVDYVSMTESFDTGTPFGRAMIGILSVFAQLERENIKERMGMGRLAAVKDGKWRGGCGLPFGYRYISKSGDQGGRLVPDDMEAQAVRRMFELFLEGNTYANILRKVRAEYPLPGRGEKNKGSWTASILRNRIYIGEMYFKGQYYRGDFEHIVPDDVFWAVQKKIAEYQQELDANRKLPQHRGHMLTGFIYCGCCGSRMSYKSVPYTRKGDGVLTSYNSYCCAEKQRAGVRCPDSKQWVARELEDVVLTSVENLKLDEIQQTIPSNSPEISALEKRIATIDRQQEKLVELFTLGTISIEAIQKQSASLVAEREKLEERIDILRAADDSVSQAKFLEAVKKSSEIRTMDESQQRDLLRSLIKRLTVYPDRSVEIQWNI